MEKRQRSDPKKKHAFKSARSANKDGISESRRRSVKQRIAFYETLKSEKQPQEIEIEKEFFPEKVRREDEIVEEEQILEPLEEPDKQFLEKVTASEGDDDLITESQIEQIPKTDIDTGKQPSVSSLIGAFEEAATVQVFDTATTKPIARKRTEVKEAILEELSYSRPKEYKKPKNELHTEKSATTVHIIDSSEKERLIKTQVRSPVEEIKTIRKAEEIERCTFYPRPDDKQSKKDYPSSSVKESQQKIEPVISAMLKETIQLSNQENWERKNLAKPHSSTEDYSGTFRLSESPSFDQSEESNRLNGVRENEEFREKLSEVISERKPKKSEEIHKEFEFWQTEKKISQTESKRIVTPYEKQKLIMETSEVGKITDHGVYEKSSARQKNIEEFTIKDEEIRDVFPLTSLKKATELFPAPFKEAFILEQSAASSSKPFLKGADDTKYQIEKEEAIASIKDVSDEKHTKERVGHYVSSSDHEEIPVKEPIFNEQHLEYAFSETTKTKTERLPHETTISDVLKYEEPGETLEETGRGDNMELTPEHYISLSIQEEDETDRVPLSSSVFPLCDIYTKKEKGERHFVKSYSESTSEKDEGFYNVTKFPTETKEASENVDVKIRDLIKIKRQISEPEENFTLNDSREAHRNKLFSSLFTSPAEERLMETNMQSEQPIFEPFPVGVLLRHEEISQETPILIDVQSYKNKEFGETPEVEMRKHVVETQEQFEADSILKDIGHKLLDQIESTQPSFSENESLIKKLELSDELEYVPKTALHQDHMFYESQLPPLVSEVKSSAKESSPKSTDDKDEPILETKEHFGLDNSFDKPDDDIHKTTVEKVWNTETKSAYKAGKEISPLTEEEPTAETSLTSEFLFKGKEQEFEIQATNLFENFPPKYDEGFDQGSISTTGFDDKGQSREASKSLTTATVEPIFESQTQSKTVVSSQFVEQSLRKQENVAADSELQQIIVREESKEAAEAFPEVTLAKSEKIAELKLGSSSLKDRVWGQETSAIVTEVQKPLEVLEPSKNQEKTTVLKQLQMSQLTKGVEHEKYIPERKQKVQEQILDPFPKISLFKHKEISQEAPIATSIKGDEFIKKTTEGHWTVEPKREAGDSVQHQEIGNNKELFKQAMSEDNSKKDSEPQREKAEKGEGNQDEKPLLETDSEKREEKKGADFPVDKASEPLSVSPQQFEIDERFVSINFSMEKMAMSSNIEFQKVLMSEEPKFDEKITGSIPETTLLKQEELSPSSPVTSTFVEIKSWSQKTPSIYETGIQKQVSKSNLDEIESDSKQLDYSHVVTDTEERIASFDEEHIFGKEVADAFKEATKVKFEESPKIASQRDEITDVPKVIVPESVLDLQTQAKTKDKSPLLDSYFMEHEAVSSSPEGQEEIVKKERTLEMMDVYSFPEKELTKDEDALTSPDVLSSTKGKEWVQEIASGFADVKKPSELPSHSEAESYSQLFDQRLLSQQKKVLGAQRVLVEEEREEEKEIRDPFIVTELAKHEELSQETPVASLTNKDFIIEPSAGKETLLEENAPGLELIDVFEQIAKTKHAETSMSVESTTLASAADQQKRLQEREEDFEIINVPLEVKLMRHEEIPCEAPVVLSVVDTESKQQKDVSPSRITLETTPEFTKQEGTEEKSLGEKIHKEILTATNQTEPREVENVEYQITDPLLATILEKREDPQKMLSDSVFKAEKDKNQQKKESVVSEKATPSGEFETSFSIKEPLELSNREYVSASIAPTEICQMEILKKELEFEEQGDEYSLRDTVVKGTTPSEESPDMQKSVLKDYVQSSTEKPKSDQLPDDLHLKKLPSFEEATIFSASAVSSIGDEYAKTVEGKIEKKITQPSIHYEEGFEACVFSKDSVDLSTDKGSQENDEEFQDFKDGQAFAIIKKEASRIPERIVTEEAEKDFQFHVKEGLHPTTYASVSSVIPEQQSEEISFTALEKQVIAPVEEKSLTVIGSSDAEKLVVETCTLEEKPWLKQQTFAAPDYGLITKRTKELEEIPESLFSETSGQQEGNLTDAHDELSSFGSQWHKPIYISEQTEAGELTALSPSAEKTKEVQDYINAQLEKAEEEDYASEEKSFFAAEKDKIPSSVDHDSTEQSVTLEEAFEEFLGTTTSAAESETFVDKKPGETPKHVLQKDSESLLPNLDAHAMRKSEMPTPPSSPTTVIKESKVKDIFHAEKDGDLRTMNLSTVRLIDESIKLQDKDDRTFTEKADDYLSDERYTDFMAMPGVLEKSSELNEELALESVYPSQKYQPLDETPQSEETPAKFTVKMTDFAKKAGLMAGGVVLAPVAAAAYTATSAVDAIQKQFEKTPPKEDLFRETEQLEKFSEAKKEDSEWSVSEDLSISPPFSKLRSVEEEPYSAKIGQHLPMSEEKPSEFSAGSTNVTDLPRSVGDQFQYESYERTSDEDDRLPDFISETFAEPEIKQEISPDNKKEQQDKPLFETIEEVRMKEGQQEKKGIPTVTLTSTTDDTFSMIEQAPEESRIEESFDHEKQPMFSTSKVDAAEGYQEFTHTLHTQKDFTEMGQLLQKSNELECKILENEVLPISLEKNVMEEKNKYSQEDLVSEPQKKDTYQISSAQNKLKEEHLISEEIWAKAVKELSMEEGFQPIIEEEPPSDLESVVELASFETPQYKESDDQISSKKDETESKFPPTATDAKIHKDEELQKKQSLSSENLTTFKMPEYNDYNVSSDAGEKPFPEVDIVEERAAEKMQQLRSTTSEKPLPTETKYDAFFKPKEEELLAKSEDLDRKPYQTKEEIHFIEKQHEMEQKPFSDDLINKIEEIPHYKTTSTLPAETEQRNEEINTVTPTGKRQEVAEMLKEDISMVATSLQEQAQFPDPFFKTNEAAFDTGIHTETFNIFEKQPELEEEALGFDIMQIGEKTTANEEKEKLQVEEKVVVDKEKEEMQTKEKMAVNEEREEMDLKEKLNADEEMLSDLKTMERESIPATEVLTKDLKIEFENAEVEDESAKDVVKKQAEVILDHTAEDFKTEAVSDEDIGLCLTTRKELEMEQEPLLIDVQSLMTQYGDAILHQLPPHQANFTETPSFVESETIVEKDSDGKFAETTSKPLSEFEQNDFEPEVAKLEEEDDLAETKVTGKMLSYVKKAGMVAGGIAAAPVAAAALTASAVYKALAEPFHEKTAKIVDEIIAEDQQKKVSELSESEKSEATKFSQATLNKQQLSERKSWDKEEVIQKLPKFSELEETVPDDAILTPLLGEVGTSALKPITSKAVVEKHYTETEPTVTDFEVEFQPEIASESHENVVKVSPKELSRDAQHIPEKEESSPFELSTQQVLQATHLPKGLLEKEAHKDETVIDDYSISKLDRQKDSTQLFSEEFTKMLLTQTQLLGRTEVDKLRKVDDTPQEPIEEVLSNVFLMDRQRPEYIPEQGELEDDRKRVAIEDVDEAMKSQHSEMQQEIEAKIIDEIREHSLKKAEDLFLEPVEQFIENIQNIPYSSESVGETKPKEKCVSKAEEELSEVLPVEQLQEGEEDAEEMPLPRSTEETYVQEFYYSERAGNGQEKHLASGKVPSESTEETVYEFVAENFMPDVSEYEKGNEIPSEEMIEMRIPRSPEIHEGLEKYTTSKAATVDFSKQSSSEEVTTMVAKNQPNFIKEDFVLAKIPEVDHEIFMPTTTENVQLTSSGNVIATDLQKNIFADDYSTKKDTTQSPSSEELFDLEKIVAPQLPLEDRTFEDEWRSLALEMVADNFLDKKDIKELEKLTGTETSETTFDKRTPEERELEKNLAEEAFANVESIEISVMDPPREHASSFVEPRQDGGMLSSETDDTLEIAEELSAGRTQSDDVTENFSEHLVKNVIKDIVKSMESLDRSELLQKNKGKNVGQEDISAIRKSSYEHETDYEADLKEKLELLERENQKVPPLHSVDAETSSEFQDSYSSTQSRPDFEARINKSAADMVEDILQKAVECLSQSSSTYKTATSKDGYETCVTSQDDAFETADSWLSQDSEYTTATSGNESRVSEVSEDRRGSVTPIAALSPTESIKQLIESENEEDYLPLRPSSHDDSSFVQADEESEEKILKVSSSGVLLAPALDPGRPVSPVPPRPWDEESGGLHFQRIDSLNLKDAPIFSDSPDLGETPTIKISVDLPSETDFPNREDKQEDLVVLSSSAKEHTSPEYSPLDETEDKHQQHKLKEFKKEEKLGKVEGAIIVGSITRSHELGDVSSEEQLSFQPGIFTGSQAGAIAGGSEGPFFKEASLPDIAGSVKSVSLDSLEGVGKIEGGRKSNASEHSSSSHRSSYEDPENFTERLTPELKFVWSKSTEKSEVSQCDKPETSAFSPEEEYQSFFAKEGHEEEESELPTVAEEPEEADSLNGRSVSSNGRGSDPLALAGKYKHPSSDNVSETSLQEFERIERDVLNRGETGLSSSELELYLAGKLKGSTDGSQSSLTEFERLEQEIGETSPQEEVMMLSDIREESEVEEMSIRDDDEDRYDSIEEFKSVPVGDEKLMSTPLASPTDSIEDFEHVNPILLETSTDSLELFDPKNLSQLKVHEDEPGFISIEKVDDNLRDSLEDISYEAFQKLKDEEVTEAAVPQTSSQMSSSSNVREQADDGKADTSSGASGAGPDGYPTTVTTFETTQVSTDGTIETISRRVLTRIKDPLITHVHFTGTENEERLRQLALQEQYETSDPDGNVTRTVYIRREASSSEDSLGHSAM